jgi:hypothetical protein
MVTFTDPDGPTGAVLWLDEATYDALQPGSSIVVRYVPWIPFIARPADTSTLSLVPWRWLVIAGLLLMAVFAVRPLFRRASPFLQGVAILGGLAVAAVWLILPAPWETPLEPPLLTTIAEVRGIHAETRSFLSGRSSIPAPQPWNLVELHFVPAGRDRIVVAVDDVDDGSVPGLATGARLPVTYSKGNPRGARLAGTRTYRRREWGELGEWIVAAVAVFGGFFLLKKAAGAWWRRLTRRS